MELFADYPAKRFSTKEVILMAGELPGALFYLKRGNVAQYVDSHEGKELIIHIYMPGALFPLSWGLNNEIPNFSLKAINTCEVTLVPKKDFEKLINERPEELIKLTKNLALGISGLAKRIEILNFENAQTRVLSTLEYLRKHFGEKFQFTHEMLAALTGLTRERVSIEMKRLKDKKVLDYKRGVITLK